MAVCLGSGWDLDQWQAALTEWIGMNLSFHGLAPFGAIRQIITSPRVQNPSTQQDEVIVTKYASRHWAVWLHGELVAVTVYRKGAQRVAELLRDRQSFNLAVQETPQGRCS